MGRETRTAARLKGVENQAQLEAGLVAGHTLKVALHHLVSLVLHALACACESSAMDLLFMAFKCWLLPV